MHISHMRLELSWCFKDSIALFASLGIATRMGMSNMNFQAGFSQKFLLTKLTFELDVIFSFDMPLQSGIGTVYFIALVTRKSDSIVLGHH